MNKGALYRWIQVLREVRIHHIGVPGLERLVEQSVSGFGITSSILRRSRRTIPIHRIHLAAGRLVPTRVPANRSGTIPTATFGDGTRLTPDTTLVIGILELLTETLRTGGALCRPPECRIVDVG